MGSLVDQEKVISNEEENCLVAMQLATATVLPLVLKAALDLKLLEILAKASPDGNKLSSADIASQLPSKNPDAASVIDRILRFLASHSIVSCTIETDKEGHNQALYGLAPIATYFLPNEDGVSFAPLLHLSLEKYSIDNWYFLKDAVLEGGLPFVKAHGKHWFEMVAKDPNMSSLFNDAMYHHTAIVMKKILDTYKGFDELTELIDVGGGLGANLKLIVARHPQIKGINFDLPYVIQDAPSIPGVEHVGGDMFQKVPQGKAIFMKWILHDWGNDKCLTLLKNCFEALPEDGKVISVESVVPEFPSTDLVTQNVHKFDISMFQSIPGAKERTQEEFETLAKKAGFKSLRLVCRAHSYWVMELLKN